MRYATGYNPDPDGHKRTPFAHLARRIGIGSLPASAMALLACLSMPPFDQGQTGSCTGHACAGATFAECQAAGNPLGFAPSPAKWYGNARAIDRVPNPDGTLPLLEDNGAQPNQAWRAAEEWGVEAMGPAAPDGRNSDADPSTINAEPMLGDLEVEAAELLIGDYEITSTGAQRITDMKTALAANHPITVAIAGGSDTFQGYTGGVMGPIGTDLDHYVFLFGYETDPITGEAIFHGRNSWGDWGEAGNFRLNEAGAQELGDLVVAAVSRKGGS